MHRFLECMNACMCVCMYLRVCMCACAKVRVPRESCRVLCTRAAVHIGRECRTAEYATESTLLLHPSVRQCSCTPPCVRVLMRPTPQSSLAESHSHTHAPITTRTHTHTHMRPALTYPRTHTHTRTNAPSTHMHIDT